MRWRNLASTWNARLSGPNRLALPEEGAITCSTSQYFTVMQREKRAGGMAADRNRRFGTSPGRSAAEVQNKGEPVALVERAIANSSQVDDLVIDLFGASGTTLIACERLGRRCRVMESDPRFADAIVRRWQDYTGMQARLNGGGRSFAQIAKERRGGKPQNLQPQARATPPVYRDWRS